MVGREEDFVAKFRADTSELERDLDALEARLGERDSGSGFLGRFFSNLEGRVEGLISSQINRLFARGLQSLFGGKRKTTTTTSTSFRGGGSQFSQTSSPTSGSGAVKSSTQTSSDLARIISRADRNS